MRYSETLTRPVAAVSRTEGDEAPILATGSPLLKSILSKVDLIARSRSPVLLTGESGTGKEVIARLIHGKGSAQERPFVALNCAALPKDVIDNELFGHDKEAFTGAVSKKPGCFELADHGTLLLDEIGEMPPQLQTRLLRVIERGSFRRLGGDDEVRVDVRIIAATNKDIPSSLKTGEIREDLYYRLGVIEMHLPPLRDRSMDIPILANHFLDFFCRKYGKAAMSFSDSAIARLTEYLWPGNIRELKNLIENLVLVAPESTIEPDHLPSRCTKVVSPTDVVCIPLGSSMKDAEREMIIRTFRSANNNKSETARVLGMSRKTLHLKLAEYGIQ